MNLRDLQYLVAVADHRHFGAAAAACFVSQPTLSTQIRKLESELGVELVERNPRHIALTPAGERIVVEARSVLEEIEAIHTIARAAQDPEAGSVRIGLFPTLAPYLLPHVMPAVTARFPKLRVLLVEEKTDVLIEQVRAGHLDAAILARPVTGEHFHEHPLFSEDFVLAVPADHHLAARRAPVPPALLTDEDVLLLEEGHCLREQALAVCAMVGASEHAGFRATSLETMRQMVAAGIGVTLLPRLATQPPVAHSPRLMLLPFAPPVPQRSIAMYWRPSNPLRALLPDLAETMGAVPEQLLHGDLPRPANQPISL